jgi:hypothetical protein
MSLSSASVKVADFLGGTKFSCVHTVRRRPKAKVTNLLVNICIVIYVVYHQRFELKI